MEVDECNKRKTSGGALKRKSVYVFLKKAKQTDGQWIISLVFIFYFFLSFDILIGKLGEILQIVSISGSALERKKKDFLLIKYL